MLLTHDVWWGHHPRGNNVKNMKLEEYEIDGFSITKVTDNLFEEGVSLHLDKKYFKKASDLMKKHKIHQIEINIDSLNDLDFFKHFDFITGLTFISVGKLSSYKGLYNLTKLEKFEDLTESGLENFSIDFNAFVHLRKCKIFWNKNIVLNTKIEFLQLFNFNDKNLEKISKLLIIKELYLDDSKLLSLVGMENLLYLKVFKIWNLSKLETLNPIDRLAETLNQV